MKIKFKSRQFDKDNKEVGKIEFLAPLTREREDDGFISLTFEENRDGKIITNRIEYNNDSLRIYSGVSSLHCKLNEVIKNDFSVNGQVGSFFLYTKMEEINVEDERNLRFKYLISATEKCEEGNIILIELEIND